ncbi:MAG: shikimate dehydrogenase [Chloroflexi bacterium]|nr:shikimate dehydrogenase [Chloroflexota bacterium]
MKVTIKGTTRLVGVMGWPVKHSVSPAMHNAAFAHLGLDWAYLPLPVMPEQVGAALAGLKAMGFAGSNVTVPHKQTVMPFLQELSPAAQALGAVNTIVVDGERLLGDNTDWAGFLAALAEAGYSPDGQDCAVLGAGGSARAIVYALASRGAQVTVYNRNLERARQLVVDLAPVWPQSRLAARPLSALAQLPAATRLLVNTTPVGMWPNTGVSPWPEGLPLPDYVTVYDLVYNPGQTTLLEQARSAGVQGIGGLGMLIHQGAIAFTRWTGQQAPIAVMRAACAEALQSPRK